MERLARLPVRDWDRLARIAILVGAVLRVLWGLVLHPPYAYVYSDMQGYVDRATHLASGLPLTRFDAFYPPGTHVLLALPLAIFGTGRTGLWADAILWTALSALTPYFVWRLSRRLIGPVAAAVAALLAALWPLHITYAGYFLSETPALAFLTASLWLAYEAAARPRDALRLAVAAGALGAIAMANRPQFAFNLAVVLVPWLWQARHRIERVPLRAGAFVGGAAAVLLLVFAHNTVAAGSLTAISENGGFTFYLGHCDVRWVRTVDPQRNVGFVFATPIAVQRGTGADVTFTDHLAWDQSFFYGLGTSCIERDGVAHLRVVARNALDMLASTVPWPQVVEPGVKEVANATNTLLSVALPFIVVGGIGLIRRRWPDALASGTATLLAHLACVLPLAILVFGDPRFRTPYDVFAFGLVGAIVADRLTRHGRRVDERQLALWDGDGWMTESERTEEAVAEPHPGSS